MSNGLMSLNQVMLPRLSPVMWAVPQGYPRKQEFVKIQPIDVGMSRDTDDGRYVRTVVVRRNPPYWHGYNSVARLRPITLGSNGETAQDSPRTGFWFPFLLAVGGVFALNMFFGRQAPPVAIV